MPNSVFYSVAAAAVNHISGFHKHATTSHQYLRPVPVPIKVVLGVWVVFAFFLGGCLTLVGHNSTTASSTNMTH